MKIIDITQELFSCRVYPGDTPPKFKRVRALPQDEYNFTAISMSVHGGTHVDAPNHFIENGKAIHEVDLSVFYGECTVVEFEGIVSTEDMAGILQTCRERLLFKGENELSEGAAELLAGSHVRLIGVESQSVGNFANPFPIHLILLEKEIIPMEGLDLSRVSAGEYVLAAFPLKMEGADGSPVRAVLIAQK